MASLDEIARALEGKVRGKPAAITLFYEGVHEAYQGQKIDPCGIVRCAMDLDQLVYVDRAHQDCLSGAFTAGFHEGSDETRTGLYIFNNIPAYTRIAAGRIKTGANALPQGLVKGIGAAPIDRVPEGVDVHWLCVVCNPYWAGFIGAARTVIDGTPPRSSCGISFCADLFASPWHDNNVVVTPGDTGGRMNNKVKPEEMFVIVPMQWADSLVRILTEIPNTKQLYESIKPENSDYWVKKQKKGARQRDERAGRASPEEPPAPARSASWAEPTHDLKSAQDVPADKRDSWVVRAKRSFMRGSMSVMGKIQGTGADMGALPFSMAWDTEAEQLIRKAPKGIVEMAVHNVEEFAEQHGHPRITREVILAQMRDVGMDPAILDT
jgi:uncharacterized protein (DUF169 family)